MVIIKMHCLMGHTLHILFFHNPTGNKAYIMNMYTNPAYRRNSQEATEMRCPLYKKFGFVKMNNEMELLI